MIFKPEMVDKILAGHKTVTRRLVKLEDNGYGGAVFLPCRYEVGKDYAVQPVIEEGPGRGRGGKEVARIRIVSSTRERLNRILTSEAREEGFASREAFFAYWRKLYPGSDLTELVDVYAFELLPPAQTPNSKGPQAAPEGAV